MAKKKTLARAAWTKEDVRALKAHSKSKTPAVEVAKALKRTEGAVRQKAKTIGVGLGTDRNAWQSHHSIAPTAPGRLFTPFFARAFAH